MENDRYCKNLSEILEKAVHDVQFYEGKLKEKEKKLNEILFFIENDSELLSLAEDFFEKEDGFLIEVLKNNSWEFVSLDKDTLYNLKGKAHIFKGKNIDTIRKLRIIKLLEKDGYSEDKGTLRISPSKNIRG